MLKAEGDRNEALRKVGSLEKVVEAERARINKDQKEKEELEQKNAKLAEKLKHTHRPTIKHFMASDEFSKMSITWFSVHGLCWNRA